MSASFYDIMRYAKTGIASSDMTAYDKMRAMSMAGGGAIKTLSGVPPLSFRANGKPLISWSMLGNSQQNGTPTPDAPIMPTFCGERTENLCTGVSEGYWVAASSATAGRSTTDSGVAIPVLANTNYTISTKITQTRYRAALVSELPGTGSSVSALNVRRGDNTSADIKINSGAASYLILNATDLSQCQIEIGADATDFEPYGWKIPVTSAGQTVPVYLGQVQTVRRVKKFVLTGDSVTAAYSAAWGKAAVVAVPRMLSGAASDYAFAVCSHYPNITRNDLYSHHKNGLAPSNESRCIISDTRYTTLEDIKTFFDAQYTAGTPVAIWYAIAEPETAIVNEPLAKIGTYADTLDSADAGITIPTAKGANTLTVDTDLQPSSMTITYQE